MHVQTALTPNAEQMRGFQEGILILPSTC